MQKTIIASATIIAIGIAVGLIFSGRREPIRDIASDSMTPRDNKVISSSPQMRHDPAEGSYRTATGARQVGDLTSKKARRRTEAITWREISKGLRAGWIEPFNISKNEGNSAGPSLAIDKEGKVYVAWHDNSSGNYEILCSRRKAGDAPSEDKRWSEPLNISKSEGISASPTLATDGEGAIHAVWADSVKGEKDLFYSKSITGAKWSNPTNISRDRERSSYYPSLVTDSKGNLRLVSNDTLEHESDIFYRSNVGGEWRESATQKISKHEEDSMGSFIPRIALDSRDRPFVVCHYFAPKGAEIHCIERSPGQEKWSVNSISKASPGSNSRSFNPAIAIDRDDIVHVAWDAKLSGNSPSQIFYSRKSGGSWSKPVVVSGTPEDATNPSIAVDANGGRHVVWMQKVADRKEIFYVHYAPLKGEMSTDGLVNISSTLSDSVSPRISMDGDNNVHVVWSEIVDKQAEIYYSLTRNSL